MNTFEIQLAQCRFTFPQNQSIIVLANYRTGSTALCNILHRITGYPNLDEAFHFRRRGREYDRYRANAQPCIVKLMCDQIPPDSYFDSLFSNSYIIGIYRKDRVAQLASFATAYGSEVWHNPKDCPAQQDKTAPHIGYLPNQAKRLARLHEEYTQCRTFMKMELCYETVASDLVQSSYNAMHKSADYENFLAECGRVLEQNNLELTNE